MDSVAYGFSEQDLIDLRFYCDVTGKTPQQLSDEVKAQSKDPTESKIRDIAYRFLTQKRSEATVTQLITELTALSEMAKAMNGPAI